MKTYTGKGDRGTTGMGSPSLVSKADERIAAIGEIDELIASLGVLRASYPRASVVRELAQTVPNDLRTIADALTVNDIARHVLPEAQIASIEKQIDLWSGTETPTQAVGQSPLSAELIRLWALSRRTERAVIAAGKRTALHPNTVKYINRLSDLFYAAAAFAEADAPGGAMRSLGTDAASYRQNGTESAKTAVGNTAAQNETERIVDAVLSRLGGGGLLTLERAKRLIQEIETYAAAQGKAAVIAVCNAQGNPIAVHVMDGSYLVSFDVAVKKAYTAVAVKMSTMELSALVQPGETFYGLQKLDKVITFGGGVPLYIGGVLVGGLGISGGTGEEDHALCEYGLTVFANL